jgi:flagellar biosynthesis/type III secretory pathway protein FliH
MATVIKSGERPVGGQVSHVSSFNFDDMTDRANDYLQEVRREAGRILEQARQEAELIRRRAREEGRQQAVEVATNRARVDLGEQLQNALPAVQRLVAELKQSRQEWIRQWENNVVCLAARIAARMMRREAVHNPEITLGLIRESLELAAGNGEIALHLNPADYETLQPQLELLEAELEKLAPIQILPDPQVTCGGCRVETKFGTIDQQIEAQVDRIEEELTLC